MKTGKLEILEKEKNNPLIKLCQIYGIGNVKAKELLKQGITNLEELENNKNLLNDKQKKGLKYFKYIKNKIPREEIEKYEIKIKKIFNKLSKNNKKSRIEIVGSYRRGMKLSGDIDIIITHDDSNIFNNFINELINDNIVIDILIKGKTKSNLICCLNNESTCRRMDILYTSPKEYAFAILYFTGSKIFNTLQRQQANKLG